MDILNRWFRHSSPIVKMFMAISVTSAFYVGHKLWYAPYANRQRHRQAEDWANMILEQEEKVTNERLLEQKEHSF